MKTDPTARTFWTRLTVVSRCHHDSFGTLSQLSNVSCLYFRFVYRVLELVYDSSDSIEIRRDLDEILDDSFETMVECFYIVKNSLIDLWRSYSFWRMGGLGFLENFFEVSQTFFRD